MADTQLAIELTPGYTFQPGELVTLDKLNQLGNPTISLLTGAIGTISLLPNSVDTAQLKDLCLRANNTGRAKMQTGYVTADLIQPLAVNQDCLATGAVSYDKLANNAVTRNAIKDGEVLT